MVRKKTALGFALLGLGLGIILTAICGTGLCLILIGIGAVAGGLILIK